MNTKTDAKGQTLTYVYDVNDTLGRLKQVKIGNTVLRTFTYDSNGWGSYLNGRLARVDYGKWSELYSYHPAGGRTAKRLNYTWYNGQANLTQNLDAFWTYDTEGKVVSVKYPDTKAVDNFGQASIPVIGDTYTYTFDAMGRATDLTTTMGDGTGSYKQVQGTTYGPAGELTGLQYLQSAIYTTDFNGNYYWQTAYTQESRSYNARMQLTTLSAGSASIVYNYSSTQNNGRITSMNNGMTGENVSYQYDSLNRLITAATADQSQWGLAFDYDGFGNRLSQTVTQGSAPPMTVAVDQATNRVAGAYDANGNMTNVNGFALGYDNENRLLTAGTDTYDYAPDNKRIYKMSGQGNNQAEYVYYYSGSKKLATYQVIYYTPPGANQQTRFFFRLTSANIYFGGKLVKAEGSPVMTDRLGSVAGTRLFPYGEERNPATANERTKFATYFRDNSTGLDYAMNRYFSSQHGRFTSPDPSGSSGKPINPGSWNRYT